MWTLILTYSLITPIGYEAYQAGRHINHKQVAGELTQVIIKDGLSSHRACATLGVLTQRELQTMQGVVLKASKFRCEEIKDK